MLPPSAWPLLTAINSTYTLTLILVVIWYSGDLIHSERQAVNNKVTNATPIQISRLINNGPVTSGTA